MTLASPSLEPAAVIATFTRPRHRAAILTACSVTLTALCPFVLGYHYFSFPWFTCVGMMLLSFSRFHGVRHGIPCPELFYLASSYLTAVFFNLFLVSSKVPSLDEILWRFDSNFGYVEVPLAKFFMNHPLGNAIIRLSYLGLPLVGIIVYLSLPNSTEIRRKYCIASGLGALVLVFYLVCPAAGPLYLLREHFPYNAPILRVSSPRLIPGVSLNCAPSGHVAWALVFLWFGRRYCRRRVQAGNLLFLIITCVATLALGEHYVIDLVLAVPFAAGLWALTYRQWNDAAINWTVVLAWLIVLREGWVLGLPRPAVWAICAATLSAPWWRDAWRQSRTTRDTSAELCAASSPE